MIERDVAFNLKSIHAKIGQIMQQKINEYDLRIGLLHLAILVKKHPGKSQKELAKEMRLTEGAMSHSIKRLLNKNILEQRPLKSDMRYKRLVVTEKGEKFINDYEQYINRVYDDIFVGFNKKQLEDLDNYLEKINKNIDEINVNYLDNI